MTRTMLEEDSQRFMRSAEAVDIFVPADRSARRQLELARRRLIRSVVRILRALSDDQLATVAQYVQLITT